MSTVGGEDKTIYCPYLVKIKTLYGLYHRGLKYGCCYVTMWFVYGSSSNYFLLKSCDFK